MVNEPCEWCPMRKSTPQWHRNLVLNAADKIQQHGGFPCHDKHPESHALTSGPYKHTDCIGYAQMLANQKNPGTFPLVVGGWRDKGGWHVA
jgi:hypothetical protein